MCVSSPKCLIAFKDDYHKESLIIRQFIVPVYKKLLGDVAID
jgi:hypothetical protein